MDPIWSYGTCCQKIPEYSEPHAFTCWAVRTRLVTSEEIYEQLIFHFKIIFYMYVRIIFITRSMYDSSIIFYKALCFLSPKKDLKFASTVFFPNFHHFSPRFFWKKTDPKPTRKTTHHTRGVSHAEVAEVVEVAPVPEGPDTKALCHGVAKALRRAKRCTEAPIKSDLVMRPRPPRSPGRVLEICPKNKVNL